MHEDKDRKAGDVTPPAPRQDIRLVAELLGYPTYKIRGRNLKFRSRKADALLGYLCLAPDGRMTRELAAGLLWGESPETQARSSLRQTLLIVRRELDAAGFDALDSDRLSLFIDKSRVKIDVETLLSDLASGKPVPPRLLGEKRLPERLFDRFDGLDESFTAWLRVRRQQLHDRLRSALEDRLASPGGGADIEEVAVALLNLDPTHEPACRAYIHARARSGDFSGAVRAYDDLWRVLEEEFDTQPSADTQNLIVEIKAGRYQQFALTHSPFETGFEEYRSNRIIATSASRQIPARPDEVWPVILVEPVLQLDGPSQNWRLAQVFRHDLISRLVRFREWSVIDGETDQLAEANLPVYKVSISSVSSDSETFLSVAVKNARTNAYIWGYDYNIGPDDFLKHQSQLVGQIAMAMNVNISAERLAQVSQATVTSLTLYDRLLHGQQLHFTWRLEDSRRAQAILESIIQTDPGFEPAYCTLAQILNSRHIIFPGQRRTAENIKRADELGRAAVELDPFDSRAYLCLGWTAALQGNFESAEAQHRLALELNNNDPWTVISVAHGLAFYGRRTEAQRLAIQLRESGMITSPIYWSYYIGIMFLCGDYQGVIDAYPHFASGYPGAEVWYIAALALRGEEDEAARQLGIMERYIAERWIGRVRPSRSDIADWLGQCFPINDAEGWARLRDGLGRAGLLLPLDPLRA